MTPPGGRAGAPAGTRERFRPYVPLLRGYGPVLQLACGRGELLDLLADAGEAATGVEPDEGPAREARRRGRDVVHADVLGYLEADPAPGPFRAVVCAGLVERLEPPQALRVLAGARRVLAPGGRLLAATANPASYPVVSRRFWNDPRGTRLYDVRLLEYLCTRAGFVVERSAGNPADHPAPPAEVLGDAEPVVHPGLADAIGGSGARGQAGMEHRHRELPAAEAHDPGWAFDLLHAVKTLSDRLTETQEAARELDRVHRELVRGMYRPAEVYVVARAPVGASRASGNRVPQAGLDEEDA